MSKRSGGPVLVCAGDDRFVMPMTVMLKSVQLSLRRFLTVEVYILDGGIQPRCRRKLMASLDAGIMNIHWIDARNAPVCDVSVDDRIRYPAYYRILMPDLLPDHIDKAIYLDSDIVVIDDLSELWDVEMGDWPLLAVQEGDKTVSSEGGIALYEQLKIPADAKYLNSGVLVLDVDRWREQSIHRQIFDYLVSNKEHVVYHDQDGINAIMATRWGELDYKWNYRVDCFYPGDLYTGETGDSYLATIRKDASVVHYAAKVKPWHYGVENPAKDIFFHYVEKTAWRGYEPRQTFARNIRNKHSYGSIIRQIPIVGKLWAVWRESLHAGARQ